MSTPLAEPLGLEPRHRVTDYCPLSKRVPYQLGLRLHKQDTLLGFEPIHNFVSKKLFYPIKIAACVLNLAEREGFEPSRRLPDLAV